MELGHRIHLIDGHDLGVPGRTGTYVLHEEQLTIVETSASPSVPYILDGFKELGIDPADLKYIIVTHIHLDHAGGAGLLLQSCPQAKVVVHPKGARHLAQPSRLIEGAKAVYGDQFDTLFHPIIPVPEDRLITKADGETLEIGPNCKLRFLDTPGHANHHFSIYDPVSNGIFTGDTLGVYYHQLEAAGMSFCLPSTSPNQFDPESMLNSMERIRNLDVDRIFFGHFSVAERTSDIYNQVEKWVPIFVNVAEETLNQGGNESEVYRRLYQVVQDYLLERQIPTDHPVYDILKLDLEVGAMGLVHYLKKRK
ncbi:MBL fold metallo-hydrolase [Ammoniphilus sp. CFH 90114]|nr:MBL fold metallo-hydrolase [Ammoniphilus sp. CFH 90114]